MKPSSLLLASTIAIAACSNDWTQHVPHEADPLVPPGSCIGLPRNLPSADLELTASLAVADVDADGDVDLFEGASVRLGRGDGTFAPSESTIYSANPTDRPAAAFDAPILVDIDNDAKLDVVYASLNNTSPQLPPRLVISRGGVQQALELGPVVASVSPGGTKHTAAIATGDFNVDGNADLAFVDAGAHVLSVFLGNGDRTFEAERVIVQDSAFAWDRLAVADIDGDGRSDIITAIDATVSVYMSRGDGSFDPPVLSTTRGMEVFADLNRDGRADLVTMTTAALGRGDGSFDAEIMHSASWERPAIADVNRDGKLDLVTTDGMQHRVTVSLGNGDGSFRSTQSYWTPLGAHLPFLADADGDGFLDLVTAASPVGVMFGYGDGAFAGWQLHLIDSLPVLTPLAVGDLNRDGRPEVITASGNRLFVLRGTPGGLSPSFDFSADSPLAALAVGDVDGDMNTDVVGLDDSALTLWLGDGDGMLRAPIHTAMSGLSLAVADLNDDGRADIVVAATSRVQIVFGAANGSIGTSRVYETPNLDCGEQVEPWLRNSVAVGDLNGDRWPDIVASGCDASVRLVSLGDGRFRAPVVGEGGVPVSIADLDGDGTTDLAAGNSLHRGIGDGNFEAARPIEFRSPLGFDRPAVVVGDVDGDGVSDLAANPLNGRSMSVLIRTSLLFATQIDVPTALAHRPELHDIDGDGRADLVAVQGNRLSLFMNRCRM